MSDEDTSQQPKGYIILDTNILQYFNDVNMGPELIKYFSEIEAAHFTFALSEISYFEATSGIPRGKEDSLDKALGLFTTFPVTKDVCVASGQLATIYRTEQVEFDHIEQGDKIIAATAVLTNSLVMTANSNDFPRPFFKELHKRLIFYKRKNKDQMMSFYLLQPDVEHIIFRYNNRP